MDYTLILKKAVEKQDYKEDIKDFTAEQKAELNIKISEAFEAKNKETLSAIEARRAELKRLEDKNPPEPQNQGVVEKFQKEQEDEARADFFGNSDFKIPDDLKQTFEDTYKTLKKGEVSKTQLTQVLRTAYAATMKDSLLDSHKKVEEMKKGAHQFNSGGANASVVISPADRSKYSQAAQELFASWQKEGYTGKTYTLDRAQAMTTSGMARNL